MTRSGLSARTANASHLRNVELISKTKSKYVDLFLFNHITV